MPAVAQVARIGRTGVDAVLNGEQADAESRGEYESDDEENDHASIVVTIDHKHQSSYSS